MLYKDLALSENHVEKLQDTGYFIAPFLDDHEIQALKDIFAAEVGSFQQGIFFTAAYNDVESKFRIREAILALLSEKMSKFLPGFYISAALFIAKSAHSNNGTLALHQDYSMVDHSKHLALNAWFPLIDVDGNNGCLCAVPRSHRVAGIRAASLNPTPYDDMLPSLESEYAVKYPMRAGEMMLFDQRVLHGSGENNTDTPRIALQITMLPVGLPMRYYYWNKNQPNRINAYEVGMDVHLKLPISVQVDDPTQYGLTLIESTDFAVQQVSREDLAELGIVPVS